MTGHHLEFLNLKGGCTGSSSLHLSKSHIVGKYHVATHLLLLSLCVFVG